MPECVIALPVLASESDEDGVCHFRMHPPSPASPPLPPLPASLPCPPSPLPYTPPPLLLPFPVSPVPAVPVSGRGSCPPQRCGLPWSGLPIRAAARRSLQIEATCRCNRRNSALQGSSAADLLPTAGRFSPHSAAPLRPLPSHPAWPAGLPILMPSHPPDPCLPPLHLPPLLTTDFAGQVDIDAVHYEVEDGGRQGLGHCLSAEPLGPHVHACCRRIGLQVESGT